MKTEQEILDLRDKLIILRDTTAQENVSDEFKVRFIEFKNSQIELLEWVLGYRQ